MNKVIFIGCLALFCNFCTMAQQQPLYEVYALKYAVLARPTPISDWVQDGPTKDSINIAFVFWLIKGNNGKNILVDAGCAAELPNAVDFGLTAAMRPDSVLLQANVKAEAVTDIIISHPHWDHINGISLFPNAQIWIQKEDYNYYTGQAWQKGSNRGGFVKQDMLRLVDMNVSGKVTLVDGDSKEIIPGITVYTGSKHTYEAQYVLVQSGNDRILIASDNVWVYDNLNRMLPPPPYGTYNAAAYVAAMQRMKTLASKIDFILPGHDDQLFSKFRHITERVVQIK